MIHDSEECTKRLHTSYLPSSPGHFLSGNETATGIRWEVCGLWNHFVLPSALEAAIIHRPWPFLSWHRSNLCHTIILVKEPNLSNFLILDIQWVTCVKYVKLVAFSYMSWSQSQVSHLSHSSLSHLYQGISHKCPICHIRLFPIFTRASIMPVTLRIITQTSIGQINAIYRAPLGRILLH